MFVQFFGKGRHFVKKMVQPCSHVSTRDDADLKLFSIAAIFAVSMIGIAAPLGALRLKAVPSREFLGLANTFSAGVFLAVGLVHLLPEAVMDMQHALGSRFVEVYRPEFAVCILGYTLILTIQRVIFPSVHCPSQVHDVARCHPRHRHTTKSLDGSGAVLPESMPVTREASDVSDYGSMHVETVACCRPSDEGTHHGDFCPQGSPELCQSFSHIVLREGERIAFQRSYALLLALSAHALAEGAALGLQCGRQNILLLLGAILSHKWAESLALGATFLSSGMAVREILKIAVMFSMSSPIGVVLGSWAGAHLPAVASGAIKALSSGTFLYIGASEVVVEEFVQGRQYWHKWVAFILGLLVIYVTTVEMQ